MLSSNELNLLSTLCGFPGGAKRSSIPEKLEETLETLIKKRLIIVSEEGEEQILKASPKARLSINAAKSEMNFNHILNEMSPQMLINLFHRMIEHSAKKGIHLNVVFKKLSDDNFEYISQEISKALDERMLEEEVQNFSNNNG